MYDILYFFPSCEAELLPGLKPPMSKRSPQKIRYAPRPSGYSNHPVPTANNLPFDRFDKRSSLAYSYT